MKMAKVNTLFSYFTKKSSPKTGNKSEQKRSEVLSARKNDNKISDVKRGAEGKSSCSFQLHDIVWAKLEGYPWWPSMVANHPKTNKHTKLDHKQTYIHVQFFDDPPSRAWVKEKFVKPYRGSDSKEFQKGGQFYSLNPKCQKAATEADKALKMDQKNRSSLVVVMESSDEDEDMDVDDDEDELSSSKENTESPKKEAPEVKPQKKRTRDSGCMSIRSKPNKRRRIVIPSDSEEEDDESGDEFKPPASDDDDEDDDDVSSGVDEDEVSDVEESSEPETPVKKQKRSAPANLSTKKSKKCEEFLTPTSVKRTSQNKTLTPSVSDKTKSKLSLFSAPEEAAAGSSGGDERTFPHLTFDFLQPNKIKDRDGNPKGSPDYSPHTLYVPESFLSKQTPAMRQWWEMKSRHFDTVLFFKMGKFYELFHMDAVIAVNEMGLIYMKGEYAHSGFPEISFGRYAECLIQKGYKVARIEQTETPDMMTERCKQMVKSTKFDKVVRREICSIQTKGTKRYSFIDGDSSDSSNAYLLAICERVGSEPGSGQTYGVCFVDTSIGKFYIGQFEDDRHSSRLRTLIAHYPPVQVLTERGKLSESTRTMLSNNLPSAIHETLRSGTEFWDATKTLKTLSESDYFKQEDDPNAKPEWPKALSSMLAPDDALGLTPAIGYEMAIRALGAIVWYLRYSLMDEELLSMKTFETYIPVDANLYKSENNDTVPEFFFGRHKMVLDDVTLANLDILVNSNTGTTEGTLLDRLDNCCTPFGKRLLKQWLCAPLCNPDSINDRLNAVEDIQAIPDVIADVTNILKKMPDLDRLLNKIHTLGSSRRSKNHPDGRAVFFEDLVYSKRKIEDFLSALSGFQMAVDVIKLFSGRTDDFKSHLLKQTVTVDETDGGRFPDLSKELDFFTNAFDHKKAKAEGVIKPSPGVDKEYDIAIEDIQTAKSELQEYLDAQKKRTGCRNIVYWGTARNRFQLEIPDSVRHVPDDYELTSSKKGFKRYRTAEIERMFAKLTDAEERRDAALKDVMRRIFYNFDKSYVQWSSAVQCMSVLDVLINLSNYSQGDDGSMCRPQCVVPSSGTQPYLILREARHPCISRTYTGGDFIPNDTVIGIKDDQDEDELSDKQQGHSSLVLVTGPNMGGKSTLMRQVGIITIMAQLGCYVPAEKCELTPVDRVFTRLGATDRIMAGESTFFVELSETSCILRHATKHSLVLLDELGRGTATYDGTAIACAVVRELSENVRCRTLFSTHYHSLVELFSHDPNVRLGHMACMVENENEEDPTQETITFLYKFVKGACPKSYGFNAARLASIPDEVIGVAHKKAKEFQHSLDKLRHIRSLYQTETCSLEKLRELQELIS